MGSSQSAPDMEIGLMDVAYQRLRVAVRPGRGGGRPLVLCNGLGANLELLKPIVDALEGVETVTFDIAGVGGSPPPSVPARFEGLAWQVSLMLDQLGYQEADVLGASWGGMLAQQLAFQYPLRIRKLILAATAPGSVMLPGKVSAMVALANPRRYFDPVHLQKIAPKAYGGIFREHPELAPEIFREAQKPSVLGYISQATAGIGWTSIHWLHLLRQPTLVLAGVDDPLVPLKNLEYMAKRIPRARLHTFEDGHMFLLTSAQEVAAVIRPFLDEPN